MGPSYLPRASVHTWNAGHGVGRFGQFGRRSKRRADRGELSYPSTRRHAGGHRLRGQPLARARDTAERGSGLMRFKLDENVPAELASLLRAAGYDADTIAQEGLKGAQDDHVSDVCRREQRILVTFDMDFSDIRAYPPQEYPGLLVLRLWRQDTDHVLTVFGKVMQFLAAERIDGQLWVVEEDRIRIRDGSGQ